MVQVSWNNINHKWSYDHFMHLVFILRSYQSNQMSCRWLECWTFLKISWSTLATSLSVSMATWRVRRDSRPSIDLTLPTRLTLSFSSPRGLEVLVSTWPLLTPSSSTTQTGILITIYRYHVYVNRTPKKNNYFNFSTIFWERSLCSTLRCTMRSPRMWIFLR